MDYHVKTSKEYHYYDGTHKTYIVVSKDLQPILKKMDRRTKYIEYDQYCHNKVFLLSELLFIDEKYKYYNEEGYDDVLYRMCANRLWEDIARALTNDDVLFLQAMYFGKLDKKKTPSYKMSDYNSKKCKKRRILRKLKAFFVANVGKNAHDVYDRYFE